MARVGRLAGALLAETEGSYYLVGSTKVPCDFVAAGFEAAPADAEGEARPVRLAPCRKIDLAPPVLEVPLEGESLAALLAARFVISRNGSVSERLWRLVTLRGDVDSDDEPEPVVDARWLAEMPSPVWEIVRDVVLRCV